MDSSDDDSFLDSGMEAEPQSNYPNQRPNISHVSSMRSKSSADHLSTKYRQWSLRQIANRACKSIDIGSAVLPKPLFHPDAEDYSGKEELFDVAESVETQYARVLQKEFNAVVVEHHLKWAPLCTSEPGPLPNGEPCTRLGRYDFHHADSIVDWALARKMKVKGHVLVWHVTSPCEILETMDAADVREQLRRHIFTTMGHFRGRIRTWDVVNEALAPDGTLADTIFLRKLGPGYIEECFRWAHEADPSAILLYNDNKVEGIGTEKSEAFFQLLKDLKSKGVPVHGCGMQAHFNAAGTGRNRCPTPRMVKQQIHRLGKLGLSVNISEMDVRVSQLPQEVRDTAQQQIYHDIISAALSEPAFDGIWLWGFTDRHTWVTHFYYDDEPLVFTTDYNKKESYYGLQAALHTLLPGGLVGGQDVIWDSDVDEDGNVWGSTWAPPEPEWQDSAEGASGDARPDWEHAEEVLSNNLS